MVKLLFPSRAPLVSSQSSFPVAISPAVRALARESPPHVVVPRGPPWLDLRPAAAIPPTSAPPAAVPSTGSLAATEPPPDPILGLPSPSAAMPITVPSAIRRGGRPDPRNVGAGKDRGGSFGAGPPRPRGGKGLGDGCRRVALA